MVETYYQQLCQEWGYTPTQDRSTGYDSVEAALKLVGKDQWLKADDAGKQEIEDEVFYIYRTIGLVPITYYSLDGCKQAIRDVAISNKRVENKKLAVGNNEGIAFGRYWFPNIQDASWNGNDTVSLKARFNHDAKLKRAIKLCYKNRDEGENTVLPRNIRRALELVNGGTIQNFKPMNARAVWEYICPMFMGRLLDTSSGYGGRMLGAMTSNLRYHYTGIDPNTRTHQGLVAQGELLNELGMGSGYDMICKPSEEVELEAGSYDACFTSPPYFNLERYCDEPTQCMNKFKTLDEWWEGYVAQTLWQTHRALDTDGIYAVNIADYKNGKQEYKIVDHWIKLAGLFGFELAETLQMMLNVRPGVGNNRQERTYKSEGIYIFRKRSL